MEIKSSSDTIAENRNVMMNITSMFENFPWTVLQQSSKGINIIKAINQLLSMYHPDDGIIAYERVLRALFILSENLDSDIQQQIISMVPLPKGVSNDKIKNLIYKIAELIKATNSKSLYQKIVMTPKESQMKTLNENSELHLNHNILIDTPQNLELHEKFVSSVPEVFKGFPPNEISTIHSHMNYMYNTLNYNIPYVKPHVNSKPNLSLNSNEQEELLKLQSNLNWFHTPHFLYNNNFYQNSTSGYQDFSKSVDDKYFQLSINRFNNWNQCNVANMPQPLHETVKAILQDTAYLKKLYKSDIISNKQNKNEILNLKVTYDDRFVKTETNCKNRTDLYDNNVNKNSKKYGTLNKSKIFNIEEQKHFKQELKHEQAIQQDIYKMDVVHCEEEKKDTIDIQILEEDNFLMDNFMMHKKLKTSLQNFLKRIEQETLIKFPTLPRTKPLYMVSPTSKCCKTQRNLEKNNQLDISTALHTYPKPTQLEMLHKNLNVAVSKTQIIEYEKKDYIENLLNKSAVKQIKKFKYFTTNCIYYREQLLQHEPLIVTPQFTEYTATQSGLSNIYNIPYTWMRYNNWKQPIMKQLKLSQQFPFQTPKNKESSVLHYVKTMDIQCFTQDKSKQLKQNVQRKKLEDIVGKLKEIENSNMNN
ncbi:hypothetical protein K0M31_010651 [Melipona bicolor]|uniref:Uncharacterized protein n=1 Tax=Melipona bicolor TaxID=60889 RepID=A0AA40KIB7_9HYME|nr:hypothetical protein K0M31_010651 [Melipona bicolor]